MFGRTRLNAYQRHQVLVEEYQKYYRRGDAQPKPVRCITDADILHQTHQFIRDEKDDLTSGSWERRMALKYYRRLYKEYALADLSRYTEGKVGLRWRTESEVIAGKGQFECANKRCAEREGLHSYEVPFRYQEGAEVKNELVKVRLCFPCAEKLYHNRLDELRRQAGPSAAAADEEESLEDTVNAEASEEAAAGARAALFIFSEDRIGSRGGDSDGGGGGGGGGGGKGSKGGRRKDGGGGEGGYRSGSDEEDAEGETDWRQRKRRRRPHGKGDEAAAPDAAAAEAELFRILMP